MPRPKKKQRVGYANILKKKQRQYITLSELTFPLPGPWVIVTDAIDPISSLRRTYPLRLWLEQIFQGPSDTATSTDGLRRYLKLKPESLRGLIPFLKKLDEVKQPGHIVSSHEDSVSIATCLLYES